MEYSSLVLTHVSTRLVIRIVIGLVSGTLGCARRNSRVYMDTRGRNKSTIVQIASGKGKVTSSVGPRVFRVFCAKGGAITSDHEDFKVKLALYGSVMRLRNKALALASGMPRNYVFAFALPLDRIALGRWAPYAHHKKQPPRPRSSHGGTGNSQLPLPSHKRQARHCCEDSLPWPKCHFTKSKTTKCQQRANG